MPNAASNDSSSAERHSVTQSITFDRSGLTTSADTVAIGGQVFDRDGDQHLAIVTIRWVNKGAFSTKSWDPTVLARMIGWEATREAMSPCMENIAYEHLGKNAFCATGKNIGYVTPGSISITAGSWHNGCLVFPVKPA